MRIFFTCMLSALLIYSGTLPAKTPKELTSPNFLAGPVRLVMTLRFNTTATALQKQQAIDSVASMINKCVRNGNKYIMEMQYGNQNSNEPVRRNMEVAFILTFSSESDRDFFVGTPFITDTTLVDPVHHRIKKMLNPLLETGLACGPNSPKGLLLFSYVPAPVPVADTSCGRLQSYGLVTSPTNRVWLDRNLGAKSIALTETDFNGYGNLFQWGRGKRDGHACINWFTGTAGVAANASTATLSSGDVPGHALFIAAAATGDWRTAPNNNLWQGVNGINNPCPSQYRLPTVQEVELEILQFPMSNVFKSPLRLPKAGSRSTTGAKNVIAGTTGTYWTSSVDPGTNKAFVLLINASGAGTTMLPKASGFSVRCIRD